MKWSTSKIFPIIWGKNNKNILIFKATAFGYGLRPKAEGFDPTASASATALKSDLRSTPGILLIRWYPD